LHDQFEVKGSLGSIRVGPGAFMDYFRSVHATLGEYHCEIHDLIQANDRAVARMRFSGIHRGIFFGMPATGRRMGWDAAAFFTTDRRQITKLWVLGDIDGLKTQLSAYTALNALDNTATANRPL
jgi:predicted ester cyclase